MCLGLSDLSIMAAEVTLAEESKPFGNRQDNRLLPTLVSPAVQHHGHSERLHIFQMNARACRIPKSIQSRGSYTDFYRLIWGEPVFTGNS